MALIEIANVVWLGAGGWATVGLLLYLFYKPRQDNAVDRARQKLFEARDAIFIIVHEHDLDREWHSDIRHTINMFIRYAHKITWPRIVLTVYMMRERQMSNGNVLGYNTLAAITDERVRNQIDTHLKAIMQALMLLVIERSLILRSIRLAALVR